MFTASLPYLAYNPTYNVTLHDDLLKQVIMQCDVISRIIYTSNKSQYLKNEARYTRVVNANHKYLTSSLKLEGFF